MFRTLKPVHSHTRKPTSLKIKVKTLDDFISQYSEAEAELILLIRDKILELVPDVEEKISWSVPYFRLNGALCYIYRQKGTTHFYVAFAKGNQLKSNPLLTGETTVIKRFHILDKTTLDSDDFKSILLEAVALNN